VGAAGATAVGVGSAGREGALAAGPFTAIEARMPRPGPPLSPPKKKLKVSAINYTNLLLRVILKICYRAWPLMTCCCFSSRRRAAML
jgi:hypothetical protein